MSDFNRISIRSDPAKSNYDDGVSGLSLDDVRPSTVLVSAKLEPKGPVTEPLVIPIYHSSTYVVKEMEDCLDGLKEGAPIYSRLANPTTETAEAVINGLERGAGSLTFSSGMAAITSVMLGFLKSGDHVMLWIETPCNPDIYVVDVEGLTQLAKSKNILVAVDGTFGSPALQHFMPLGIDFSVHSSTKYMGGHSDLIGGCVTTRTVEQWRILKLIQGTFGNMLSPHDASLLLRGLKTLSLRMERISENAMKVATYLEQHPKVQRVRYPGLTSHPQHEVARKQMTSYSGMIMAEIKGGEKGGRAVAENVRIVRLAVSLGGVESLVEHPYTMTHGKYLMTEKEMEEACITPGMLRISIGLEDADDLIKDFGQALEKLEL
ncbi:L-methionine gamma-lyase-like isoform X2 [Physella acuta]|uniref:L-methionine gamma-lyase-like isoform X2 n=1 Tax=Physella acuta TaxID=109671 RepID=UPI0027DE088E|nr:L-methionine gamma-lyase-like isoform X2 [Physella acuta]